MLCRSIRGTGRCVDIDTVPRRRDSKHNPESGHRLDSGSPFWRIQLDQDLLDTISAIYPEWFKDYTNARASTSSSSSATSGGQLNTEGIVAADANAVLDHKVAKGDPKAKPKAKKADCLKDKERDRKEARRESKDERDAGNGKKGTKPSPQQDKAADVAGRKTAGVPGSGAEMAEGNQSPPKAEVDDSSLQHAMDRNKELRNRGKNPAEGREKSEADAHALAGRSTGGPPVEKPPFIARCVRAM
ncbi:hypothetical protein K0M31_019875 [Melipona bicolor]|uniref:Uncharacterized protein n=1 Tax=Melipona bicolor TaxID=60889 RepID=A0AA40G0D8_9HYME|nr:hypothetical protein K0M31_019875 [Melipona bicolor]